jgi:hypothetical protein
MTRPKSAHSRDLDVGPLTITMQNWNFFWTNCLLLWAVRDEQIARGLFLDALTASTAMASRMLLVAV